MNLVEKNIYRNKITGQRAEITEINPAAGRISFKFVEAGGPAGVFHQSCEAFEEHYTEIPVTHVQPAPGPMNKCFENKNPGKLCGKMHIVSKTCSLGGHGCHFPDTGSTPLNLPLAEVQPAPPIGLCDKCGSPVYSDELGTHHVGTKISHARCGPLYAGKINLDRLTPGKITLAEPFEGKEHKNPHNRDAVMSHNVGDSNYAQKRIQPWDIWEEYKLNPWDADILKRLLRDKSTQSRRMDYEKMIHLCQKRINQIDNEIKMYGED